jgi:iron complex outermembrane receptor protein
VGRVLLVATALATTIPVGSAVAQTTDGQGSERQQFEIPSGDLGRAVARFSRETGLEFAVPQQLLAGKTTDGVNGQYRVDTALQRLLAGTGLTYRREDGAIRLVDADAAGAGQGMRMSPIEVTGEGSSGKGPVDGYVAETTTTGTKTNTPITDIPQSISVIPRQQIEDQGATSVEEALQYTPGVVPQPFGRDIRFNQFNIRGFSGTTSANYSDGLQVGTGTFTVPRLEPYGQERVEVLRGPSSMLFGDGSPGGVVNLISKRAPDEFLAEAGVEYGNFDWKQAKFDVGGPLSETPGVSARLTGLVRDAETIVDFSQDDKVFVAPTIRFDLSDDTHFEILASYQKEEQFSFGTLPIEGTLRNNPNGEIDREFFVGDPNFDEFETERASIGYEFEHRFNDTFMVRQNARYAQVTNDQAVLFGAGLQSDQRTLNRSSFTVDDELDAWNVDTQAHIDVGLGPTRHRVLAGVDYQRRVADNLRGFGSAPSIDIFDPSYGVQVSDPPTFLSDVTTQDQVGVYLQDQIRAFDNVILTLGVRHDWVFEETENRLTGTTTEFDDQATSYRAGLGYSFDNGVTPYVSYSESFEPLVGTDGNGNPFEPTTAQQYEVGVKYAPVGYDALVTASAYQLEEQNIRSTDPANPSLVFQGGEIRSRGIELSARATLMDSLDLIASYTYTDAEATKATNLLPEGNTPPVTPEHTANLWANYTMPTGALKGLEIGGGVRFVGESQGDNANTITNPSYTVADARISYSWRSFEVGLRANNLFDNDYVICNGGATACSFGTARSVRANLTYRW